MTNLEIAKLLKAVAAAHQVKPTGESNERFRIIAYERAADAVEHATSEMKDLWEEKKLSEIAGIGKTIADHLDELFKTGKVKHFEEIFKCLPPAMFELLDVPGVGAKTAEKLTKELGITKAHGALEKLHKAAEKGRVRGLEGFGEQSEKEITESIREVKERTRRLLLPHATGIAEDVIAWMKRKSGMDSIDTLGSLRRSASTVGDVDIAVASNKPEEVIRHFVEYPKKTKVIEAGRETASLLLPGGVQVDLMVQPPDAYGALLQHFTGSKHHNVALRVFALKKKLSLSEHGIKKGGKLLKVSDEQKFYKALGMAWIPPELREDQGEIDASVEHKLPKLVELKDIKGDLHMHSDFPSETSHDVGVNTLQEMAEEGKRLGYEYIALTEHNPKSAESEKKILEILREKKERVDKLNDKNIIKRVFNCLEIDIQPDGKLALPEKSFDFIDFGIVSIHSSFKATRDHQTKRVLAALANPKVKIFAHPTARKLNEREGVDFDWDKIFEFCKKNGKAVEINSSPQRLDLPDMLVHKAVKQGVKLTISTDSHAKDQMIGMRYGVSVARRGWAEKKNILNTLGYLDFKKALGVD